MNALNYLSILHSMADPTEEMVWMKGRVIPGYDPSEFRQDDYGWWIKRSDYGKRDSDFGWERDHHFPSSLGGSNSLANIRPLHWRNNLAKSDNVPNALGLLAAKVY